MLAGNKLMRFLFKDGKVLACNYIHWKYKNVMAHRVHFFSLVFFLCSLNQAASKVYYITTNSNSSDLCTTPCLTLSDFASNNQNLHSNITLIFLSGTHYFTLNLSISNFDHFSMTSESIVAQVVCRNYLHISFSHCQYVSISNLELIGCGGNQVVHVEQFLVKDAVFNGLNTSSTALEIIETATQIINGTFKFNRRGKFKPLVYVGGKFRYLFVGGAIIATGSEINISQSTFENNEAEDGGAIFAEQHSVIVIHDSNFTNNSAAYSGGALLTLLSTITVKESNFIGNYVTSGEESDGGGVLYSYFCNITIEGSKFDDNAAITRGYGSGGGVLRSEWGTITIETSKFENNTATINERRDGGGVVYSIWDNITIRASKFDGNTAIRGAVLFSYSCSITISECKKNASTMIVSNKAKYAVLYLIKDSMLNAKNQKMLDP